MSLQNTHAVIFMTLYRLYKIKEKKSYFVLDQILQNGKLFILYVETKTLKLSDKTNKNIICFLS